MDCIFTEPFLPLQCAHQAVKFLRLPDGLLYPAVFEAMKSNRSGMDILDSKEDIKSSINGVVLAWTAKYAKG